MFKFQKSEFSQLEPKHIEESILDAIEKRILCWIGRYSFFSCIVTTYRSPSRR